MEDHQTASRADVGNPASPIQPDIDKSVPAEEECTSISARAEGKDQRISSQAEDRRPVTRLQADEDGMCLPIQVEGSISHIADATQPCSSAVADPTPTPLDPVQEPTESIEDFQEKTLMERVSLSKFGDVEEIQKNTEVEPGCLSTLLCTTSADEPAAHNSQEGNSNDESMGRLAGETPEVHLERANVDTAFGSPKINTQACNNLDDEFLSIGDIDESDGMSKQIGFVGSENISMHEDAPCEKGCVDDIGDIPVSPTGDRRLSLKRSRSSCFDSTPCVQVIYNCLTSDSKHKLKELLLQWAQWHGEYVGMKEEAERGPLESGDETYFPPLQVGGVSHSTVSFWMDKPSKQARTEKTNGDTTPASQGREMEVPLYDRAGTGALISQETEMSLEGNLEPMEQGSRCFNCGSYSHSLKECPRPRDAAAISNARKLLAEKRGSANGSRSASRYYQTSPGGKFDDLKPGVLGSETRQLLGIGERDPPPWLNRMRELGYPPGYLEDQEEEHSGITIFGTNEDAEGKFIGEDGEIVGEKKWKSASKKMKVHFPGVNAPIPDDADRHVWGSTTDRSTQDRPSHRAVGRSVHSNYSDGSAYEDLEGPPGCSRDNYVRNSKMRSPGFEGPLLNKTPPWQPALAPLPRSPHLSRSASDSGRRSPKVVYDEPHSLPPLGHYSSSRQSPSQNSRHFHSPSTPNQRLPHRQDNREEDSRRRAWGHAQDALHSMHHNDRYSPARRR
ncbi:hypothetical protein GOP47_0007683 [Adiantum capillus-veneris]|uniref:CCHC-type domain-containing protein n=1 Tax=Adiantum capillus-veneris TaxID=13818 RepID=A0A9D4ZJJ0_ADICA|nr:hypothetical protein GOP47_0007683 [Adiantum capillus-veneris]